MEEPHRIFLPVSDTALKEEFLEENVPVDKSSDEFPPSSPVNLVIKEEIIVDGENDCSEEEKLFSSSCMTHKIKDEITTHKDEDAYPGFSSEECLTSDMSNFISEEVSVGDAFLKTKADGSKQSMPVVLQRLPLQNASDSNSERYVQYEACNKASTLNKNISRHKLIKNCGKKNQCDEYNKTFNTSSDLTVHKLIHSEVSKYQCDVCNKAFSVKVYLSRHKLRHSGVREYQCDVCNKTFTTQGVLSQHKLIHSDIKRYLCDICGRNFTHLRVLSQHKLIHSDIKRYHCDVCGTNFTQFSSLSQHKLIHNNIRRYYCDVCNKSFTRKCHLSRHSLLHNSVSK